LTLAGLVRFSLSSNCSIARRSSLSKRLIFYIWFRPLANKMINTVETSRDSNTRTGLVSAAFEAAESRLDSRCSRMAASFMIARFDESNVHPLRWSCQRRCALPHALDQAICSHAGEADVPVWM
jgi:hypothetical protein